MSLYSITNALEAYLANAQEAKDILENNASEIEDALRTIDNATDRVQDIIDTLSSLDDISVSVEIESVEVDLSVDL